jgi:hypothetical protein
MAKKVHWTQTAEGRAHFERRRAARRQGQEQPAQETAAPAAGVTLDDFNAAVKAVAKVTGKPWHEAARTVLDLVEEAERRKS